MVQYGGEIVVEGRPRRLEVERVGGRTRVSVDGRVVHDEKPFVPPSQVTVRLGPARQTAPVVFERNGLSEDCYVVVDGKQVPLARKGAQGVAETAAERTERLTRNSGIGAFFLGFAFVLFGWPDHGRYRPVVLGAAPGAIVIGALLAAMPSKVLGWERKLEAMAGGAKAAVLGIVFAALALVGFVFVRVVTAR